MKENETPISQSTGPPPLKRRYRAGRAAADFAETLIEDTEGQWISMPVESEEKSHSANMHNKVLRAVGQLIVEITVREGVVYGRRIRPIPKWDE